MQLRVCRVCWDRRTRRCGIAACLVLLCATTGGRAEPIKVRYQQGATHGFVSLRTLDGAVIGTGEVTQSVHGDMVNSRMLIRFRDGSVDDDQTTFRQDHTFRLLTDHHVQRGPSFPKPVDVLIEMARGEVTSRSVDGKVSVEHMDLPADVSNGLPPNLLLNVLPTTAETKISYVAPGEKPRLIHITVKPSGKSAFRVGGMRKTATDFLLHIELGGLTGVIAPILGKQPSDYHIWILAGNPPAFICEEGALYQGGPIWRMEPVSPSFPPTR